MLVDSHLTESTEFKLLNSPCRYSRVAEEEQAEHRVASEEINERATQAPAGQREHSKPSHHQKN